MRLQNLYGQEKKEVVWLTWNCVAVSTLCLLTTNISGFWQCSLEWTQVKVKLQWVQSNPENLKCSSLFPVLNYFDNFTSLIAYVYVYLSNKGCSGKLDSDLTLQLVNEGNNLGRWCPVIAYYNNTLKEHLTILCIPIFGNIKLFKLLYYSLRWCKHQ